MKMVLGPNERDFTGQASMRTPWLHTDLFLQMYFLQMFVSPVGMTASIFMNSDFLLSSFGGRH